MFGQIILVARLLMVRKIDDVEFWDSVLIRRRKEVGHTSFVSV